jgi:outer membrane autotransporter protein
VISAQASASNSTANAAALVINASTFLGGITNSGSIAASANATNNAACATGVFLGSTLMIGNFSNAGMISATVIAPGGTAYATGVSVNVMALSGGIVNSGTIIATATGDSAHAVALTQYNCNTARGISQFSSIFTGGFDNTGILSANATATSGTASAVGAQLGVYSNSGSANFGNGVTNAGLISAAAVGTGSAYAHATAASIYAYGGSSAAVSGGITNSGSIISTGTATGTGGVEVSGLRVQVSTFGTIAAINGDVANGGTISATATSAQNCANATALSLSAYELNGNFTNSGAILASANGASANADAAGFFFSSFNGGFSNSGTIAANATASGTSGDAQATGLSGGALIILGDIANSGVISATATQTGVHGNACAQAGALSLYASTMFGSLTNSGTIAASAIAAGTGTRAAARATAVSFGASVMFGNVVNSGRISATAVQSGGNNCADAIAMSFYGSTMFGGVSNSGTITASGTALAGYATVTGLSVSAATVVGTIVNSGTISASATANGAACVKALAIEATQFGGVTNSGQIAAVATGHSGFAVGASVIAATMTSGFTNSGTISASFTATGGGTGFATGVMLSVSTLSGTVSNSGTIIATRTGNGTAIGIHVFPIQSGSPTIANSGTIIATDIAISLTSSGSGLPITIDQNAGLISGATAIRFSNYGDILNASGGRIDGALVGPTSGTLPTINVAAGAGGTFTYAGTTTNIGTINVNSGTMLIATQTSGAYSNVNTPTFNQAAGATLGIGVSTTPNTAPILVSSGTMTLAGPLVVYENVDNWRPGTTYTYTNALTADTLTGAFTSVGSNSPFFTASAAASGNNETITLGLLPASQVPGISGNNVGVLQAAENAGLTPIYSVTNAGQINTLLTSLSGTQNTQNFQQSVAAWSQFTSMLIDRLFGEGGDGTTGVASFTKGQGVQFAQADIPQVAQATDAGGRAGGVPSRLEPSKWGVWARGYGSFGSAPSTASSAAYDESGAGVIIGGDAQIASNFVGGFAVNIGSNAADVANGSRLDTNSYQGSLYGKYDVDQHIYVAGLAGFGWQDYDSRRFIVAPFGANATANYSGQGYRLYTESGYAIPLGGLLPDTKVTPYVGLGYLHTHVDSYTEAGGNGAALAVGAVDANSFTTSIGARASTSIRIGNTMLKPEVRAAWEHEWLDASTNVQSAFASAPGSVFTVTGASFGRDSFVGGAGISTTLAGFGVSDPRFAPTQLFIDYDVKTTGGYIANVVSGGLRAKF